MSLAADNNAANITPPIEAGGRISEFQSPHPGDPSANESIAISTVLIDPLVDEKKIVARIQIQNGQDASKPLKVICAVFDSSQQVAKQQASVIASANGMTETTLSIPLRHPRLWSPENPSLSDLRIDLIDDHDVVLASRKERFGMRTLKVGKDNRMYLNGNPIYIRGNAWVPDPAYAAIPFEPAFCRKMLSEQKKQGFNYIRHHSTVPPYQWYYDLADELGLMISVEMGFDLQKTREVMLKNYNHPCLVFWGGVNECHKTGVMPEVRKWYSTVKGIDPYRCIYDTAGYGEYDRDTTDFLNQYMGYYFPYLLNEDCYASKQIYAWSGSAKGIPTEKIAEAIKNHTLVINKPVIYHELQGNAQIYSDKTLWCQPRMRALWEHFGYDYNDWGLYVRVNQKFVNAGYKVNIEALRRTKDIVGFDFLTVADSDPEIHRAARWPGFGDMDITGTCDLMGESKPDVVKDLPVLNGAHLVLFDTCSKPRTLWNDERLTGHILASCYDYAPPKRVTLEWRLKKGKDIIQKGVIANVAPEYPGVSEIGALDLPLSSLSEPACVTLEMELKGRKYHVSNNWKFWVFPRFKAVEKFGNGNVVTTIKWLAEAGFGQYMAEIGPDARVALIISDKVGEQELKRLDAGRKVLVLQDYKKEGFSCTPAAWRHRMYHHIIGGYSMGVIVRDHPALGKFPHEEFNDLQFYQLMQPCDRFMLDDLPGSPRSILEAVPALEQNQSRNSGYLIEMQIGKGKLLASGLRFGLVTNHECSSSFLLKELVEYCLDDRFRPEYSISAKEFRKYKQDAAERIWVATPLWYLYHDASLPNTLPANGRPKAWTNPNGIGNWGSGEWGVHDDDKATDGYRATYWEPRSLPADLGAEWPSPVRLSEVRVEYVDDLSVPADDGWVLQVLQNGRWNNVEAKCAKISDKIWKIDARGVEASAFRIYFTKMNQKNCEAVARGAFPGGARAGYPFPITRIKETSVPRIREIQVRLADK